MEENRITNAQLSFACNQDWNSMTEQAEGKFCSACEKKVYDLTDKNAAYFIKIMQENNNNVCGRFSNDQLISNTESVPVQRSIWKKWSVAAMVFVGLGSLMTKANAQQGKMGKVAIKDSSNSCETTDQMSHTLGIVVMPEYQADREIYDYVAKHAKIPTSAQGKLIVTFNLRKNGSIEHLAASNHLSKAVRDEVLRVIRQVPVSKLISKDKLPQTADSHTLYFTFEKGKML